MSAASNYLENKILDHVIGGSDYTRPATIYFALFTVAPSDAGGGTEVSGNGYARVAMTNNSTNFPAASGGSKTNAVAVVFPTATGNWGTVSHYGVFDASSGGNLIVHGAMTTAKLVENGDTASYPVSSFSLTVS